MWTEHCIHTYVHAHICSYIIIIDELDETGVMSFTAQSRPKWAEIRERMCKDPINKESLECIESAYQVYILETDAAPPEVCINYVAMGTIPLCFKNPFSYFMYIHFFLVLKRLV